MQEISANLRPEAQMTWSSTWKENLGFHWKFLNTKPYQTRYDENVNIGTRYSWLKRSTTDRRGEAEGVQQGEGEGGEAAGVRPPAPGLHPGQGAGQAPGLHQAEGWGLARVPEVARAGGHVCHVCAVWRGHVSCRGSATWRGAQHRRPTTGRGADLPRTGVLKLTQLDTWWCNGNQC